MKDGDGQVSTMIYIIGTSHVTQIWSGAEEFLLLAATTLEAVAIAEEM